MSTWQRSGLVIRHTDRSHSQRPSPMTLLIQVRALSSREEVVRLYPRYQGRRVLHLRWELSIGITQPSCKYSSNSKLCLTMPVNLDFRCSIEPSPLQVVIYVKFYSIIRRRYIRTGVSRTFTQPLVGIDKATLQWVNPRKCMEKPCNQSTCAAVSAFALSLVDQRVEEV